MAQEAGATQRTKVEKDEPAGPLLLYEGPDSLLGGNRERRNITRTFEAALTKGAVGPEEEHGSGVSAVPQMTEDVLLERSRDAQADRHRSGASASNLRAGMLNHGER